MSKTVVCAHCQHTYNKHMSSCPFCGGENPKEAKVNTTPRCPRCNRPLETVDYRGTRLDLCPECSGLWLATGEFEQLTSERDVYADETIPHGYRKKPPPKEEGYLPCPLCSALMTRRNFKALSGVLIDICGHHGVWLDAGELEQIRCFIAKGGLQAYQDKRIAANAAKVRSIADSLSGTEFTQWFIHHWNLKHMLKEGILPRKKTI